MSFYACTVVLWCTHEFNEPESLYLKNESLKYFARPNFNERLNQEESLNLYTLLSHTKHNKLIKKTKDEKIH